MTTDHWPPITEVHHVTLNSVESKHLTEKNNDYVITKSVQVRLSSNTNRKIPDVLAEVLLSIFHNGHEVCLYFMNTYSPLNERVSPGYTGKIMLKTQQGAELALAGRWNCR